MASPTAAERCFLSALWPVALLASPCTRVVAASIELYPALICPVAPHAAFQHNLSLPSLERELVVQERRYPYWDHVVWCGALANFAYLPATARPITCTSAGLPMGIQIKGPYLEDRTPIHAALLMDDLFGGFVRPPHEALGLTPQQ
jgi:amidase